MCSNVFTLKHSNRICLKMQFWNIHGEQQKALYIILVVSKSYTQKIQWQLTATWCHANIVIFWIWIVLVLILKPTKCIVRDWLNTFVYDITGNDGYRWISKHNFIFVCYCSLSMLETIQFTYYWQIQLSKTFVVL